jgi:hypothetical protein
MEPGVRKYLGGISSPKRRRDAETMVELMRRATGEEPQMWGSIVGFGQYHYKHASGREGDTAAAGFAARKAATPVYRQPSMSWTGWGPMWSCSNSSGRTRQVWDVST